MEANPNMVSVIIPVYNGEEFLKDCLDSIAGQTHDNLEIIVVDDGSSDNSVSIIQGYADSDRRFKLVQALHGGVSRARNKGIDISRGKYITFVDADDCLYPEAIERMLNVLRETSAQVCVAKFTKRRCDMTRPILPSTSPHPPIVMGYEESMEKALYQHIILNAPWGALIERELLGTDIRFVPGIRYEDLDAFYRFYEKADKIAYLPEPLYYYRQRGDSFMHEWSDNRLDVLDVTDRIMAYMRERHPALEMAARDRRFSAHFNMLLLMLKLGVANIPACKRCMNVIREERNNELFSRKTRLKNKLGALASYGGLPVLHILAKLYS